MWKQLVQTEKDVDLPSPAETRRAFRVLVSNAGTLGKFCVFIDGLDEFAGDCRDAVTFLTELTTNSGFKAVISSRPISACMAAFEDCPGLQLHHLNRRDITVYVRSVIGQHKRMKTRVSSHPSQAPALMDEIVQRSCGVFL